MRRTVGKAAEDAFNPVNRDCGPTAGCLPEHDLVGGNTWVPQILRDTRWRLNGAAESAYLNATTLRAREMLQKAATITVSVDLSSTQPVATVRVINETGHKLPTGYPEGRRMWLNVKAYNDNGILVQERGAYNPATASLTTSNTKVYEAKQGLTSSAAAALNLPAGESFFFVLNNTTLKDNRIPPRGFTQAALNQRGMQPVQATYAPGQYWDDTVYVLPSTATRVMVTLYYQTASKEYIDFLRAYGGLDGTALGALWDSSKSAPEVVGRAWFPNYPVYLPIIRRSP
jgi:hypothetical protein